MLPQRLEDREGGVDVRRVLHVDAHEELIGLGAGEDPPEVVDAGGAVDAQPQLSELDRDVALDAGRRDPVEELEVSLRRGVRFGRRGHALAEQVEGQKHAGVLNGARGRDRFIDGLAGDEAARKPMAVRADAVPGRQALQRRAAGERMEERFGDGVEHQWAVCFLGAMRCWIMRA
jgi:hypothetical protein